MRQELVLEMPTLSESNQRDHWAVRARRVKAQRWQVYASLIYAYGYDRPSCPLTVTLTRIAPRALDDDNLRGALKACRDGVADWLAPAHAFGQGTDNAPGITWVYAQERGEPNTSSVGIAWVATEQVP